MERVKVTQTPTSSSVHTRGPVRTLSTRDPILFEESQRMGHQDPGTVASGNYTVSI